MTTTVYETANYYVHQSSANTSSQNPCLSLQATNFENVPATPQLDANLTHQVRGVDHSCSDDAKEQRLEHRSLLDSILDLERLVIINDIS